MAEAEKSRLFERHLQAYLREHFRVAHCRHMG